VINNEYNKHREEASLQKYHTALDELEHLVVMRLFKLSKLSLSSMGKQMILCFEGRLITIGRVQATTTNRKGITEALQCNLEHHQQV